MAKIATYNDATTPLSGGDKVIGTEATDGSTKNFTVQDLSNFVTGGSGVVNSVTGPGAIKASPTTGNVIVDLVNLQTSGTLQPGNYTLASVTVDAYGRVTSAANGSVSGGVDTVNTLSGDVTIVSGGAGLTVANTGPSEITITNTASGGGTVTSVTAGTGLNGGTITATGTIDLANSGVLAGTYSPGQIVVNAQGQITSATTLNIDLQYVLDRGILANGRSIVLTGAGVGISAPSGIFTASTLGTASCTQLTVDEQLLDRNGAFGTDGQILVADTTGAGGVVWSDPNVYVATATISDVDLNAGTPVQVVAAPGAGKYIQVISAAAKYNANTTGFVFSSALLLYTNSTVPQFELEESFLTIPVSVTRALSLTTSGDVNDNATLFFKSPGGAAGDGNLQLNVQYRIVEF